MCYEIRNKERLEKNELIRQNKLKREHKKCPVCGKKFEINKSHLVYCSAECREVATKDKKKKYFKNYYSENRDKIIENNSINQRKRAKTKIQICLFFLIILTIFYKTFDLYTQWVYNISVDKERELRTRGDNKNESKQI